jgi:hypothetical protein
VIGDVGYFVFSQGKIPNQRVDLVLDIGQGLVVVYFEQFAFILYCRPVGIEIPDQRGAEEGSKTLVPKGGSRLDEVDMLVVLVVMVDSETLTLAPQNLSMMGSWTAVSRPFETLRLGSVVLRRLVWVRPRRRARGAVRAPRQRVWMEELILKV